MLVLFSRCGDVDGCGGGFFFEGRRCQVIGRGRSAHANAHGGFTRGGGSDLRNPEEGSLQGREGTQERRPDATGTTERHWH